jgi:hypothetical protein
MKSCVGGPWLVGVTFGVYQHGPAIVDSAVVPVDLSRLRVFDARIRKLLDIAEVAKNALLSGGDVSNAANTLTEGLDRYRSEIDSSDVMRVMQGFDQVVLSILCPDQEDQRVESLLLQGEKLEEETGADAAAEFLKGFIGLHPAIRERYIDALATSHKWQEIARLVNQIDVTALSRIELEHGFSACAETGLSERASMLIRQHESVHKDNSAKLFRTQVTKRYPKSNTITREMRNERARPSH